MSKIQINESRYLASDITIEPIGDKAIPVPPIRLTKRKYSRAKTGDIARQAEFFVPSYGLLATAYVVDAGREDINDILLSTLVMDVLPSIEQYRDNHEVLILNERLLKDLIPENFYAEDGIYVQERELKEKPIDSKELQAKARILKRFILRFGDISYENLKNREVLRQMVLDLKKNGRVGKTKEFSKMKTKELEAKTVRNILICMSTVFQHLVEKGQIELNLMQFALRMLPSTSESRSFRPIPWDIVTKMLSSDKIWKDYISFAMILLLSLTGLRIGEAEVLCVEDVNIHTKKLHIRRSLHKGGVIGPTKTRTTRYVPLSDLAIKVLSPLIVNKKTDDFIFSIDGKKPFTRIKYARALEKALSAVGISKRIRQESGFVLHSFRHGFISKLVASNSVSDANISLITAHDTVKLSTMNLRYTAQLDEAFPSIIKVIDGFFSAEEISKIEATIKALCPCCWKEKSA